MTPNERTKYQAKYAQKRRVDLVRLLSPDGVCAKCAEVFDLKALTIQHVDGITWKHKELNQAKRSARYWKEFTDGVKLETLCGSCNSSDGYRFWGKHTR